MYTDVHMYIGTYMYPAFAGYMTDTLECQEVIYQGQRWSITNMHPVKMIESTLVLWKQMWIFARKDFFRSWQQQ